MDKDPLIIAEALSLLDARQEPGVWYVLEGNSAPDAYLETDDAVIVVEGERTESKATHVTTWMAQRSQMLRHMDAALGEQIAKPVFGLMIVEGDMNADPLTPSSHWLSQSEAQISVATVEQSLPHRCTAEKQAIVDGFLGVTTWQAVCSRVGIAWPLYCDKQWPSASPF